MSLGSLIRQIDIDLRAAFPDVQFSLSAFRSWWGKHAVKVFWCGDPPDNDAVEAVTDAVTAKRRYRNYSVFVDGHVPCERCGEPGYYVGYYADNHRALCAACELATN